MRPLIIGVAGGSGSGKTTVAKAIHARLGVDAVFLDQDAYYADLGHLPLAERIRTNFDHPDALDTDLMVAHLEALAGGQRIDKPTYDFAQHTRAPSGWSLATSSSWMASSSSPTRGSADCLM